jgi:hypothetical protein
MRTTSAQAREYPSLCSEHSSFDGAFVLRFGGTSWHGGGAIVTSKLAVCPVDRRLVRSRCRHSATELVGHDRTCYPAGLASSVIAVGTAPRSNAAGLLARVLDQADFAGRRQRPSYDPTYLPCIGWRTKEGLHGSWQRNDSGPRR